MRRFAVLLLSVVAIGAVLFSCNPTSILGPTDKPDFSAMEWTRMEIDYWVPRKDGPDRLGWHRHLTVSDVNVLLSLRELFVIDEVKPSSVGALEMLSVTMADGETWQGNFSWRTEFNICKTRDKYYSYYLKLSDTGFYDRIKQLCFEHEQMTDPTVTIEDIRFWREKRHFD